MKNQIVLIYKLLNNRSRTKNMYFFIMDDRNCHLILSVQETRLQYVTGDSDLSHRNVIGSPILHSDVLDLLQYTTADYGSLFIHLVIVITVP